MAIARRGTTGCPCVSLPTSSHWIAGQQIHRQDGIRTRHLSSTQIVNLTQPPRRVVHPARICGVKHRLLHVRSAIPAKGKPYVEPYSCRQAIPALVPHATLWLCQTYQCGEPSDILGFPDMLDIVDVDCLLRLEFTALCAGGCSSFSSPRFVSLWYAASYNQWQIDVCC